MESNEISIHEVKIWLALSANIDKWMTNRDIANAAKVGDRTVRMHTLKLSKLDIVNCAEVFPGHRFKISDKADKRNGGYSQRLKAAAEVFGI